MHGRGDHDTLDALTMISLPFARTDLRSGSRERGLRISGRKKNRQCETRRGGAVGKLQLTIGVLRAGHAGAEIRIVVAHAAEDAVAHALVHADRDVVRAAHEEVDEEAAVGRLGRALEEAAERARDREAAVLGRDRHRGDVPVPLRVVALGFANDCRCARAGERERGEYRCARAGRGTGRVL